MFLYVDYCVLYNLIFFIYFYYCKCEFIVIKKDIKNNIVLFVICYELYIKNK